MTQARRPPLLLIYAVTITGILSNAVVSPVIPDILDTFNKADSRAGILVAVGGMPGIVVAPLMGFAADRFGRKVVMAPSLIVFGGFGIVAATAQSFEVLLFARLAMGFGSAGMINLAVVTIGDSFSGAERTRAIGRNSAVLTAGLAVLPLVSGLISELTSWRWSLATYSLGLVTGVLVIMKLDNVKPKQSGNISTQLREAGRILRQPIMASSLISGLILFALIFGVFLATLPVHLEDEFGLGAGWRGVILAIPAVSSTVLSMNLAWLRRTFGLRQLLVTGALVLMGSFLALGLTGTLFIVVIASVAYGLSEGALIPSMQDVVASAAPDQHRGGVLAAWVSAVRIGQTGGPLLATAMIAATDTGTTIALGGVAAVILVALKAFGPIDDEALAAAQAQHD